MFRVFGAVEIRGIHESGMGPYHARVRRKYPPLTGPHPPRTALWSSNQSAISQRDRGFLTVQGGVDPRKLGLLPRLVEVLEMWSDSGPGTGPYILPRWSWLNIRTIHMANQKIGRWGWNFHTVWGGINPDDIRVRPQVVGVVDVWMDSDPGM